MATRNLLLLYFVEWLDILEPMEDAPEQMPKLKEILIELTNPSDDVSEKLGFYMDDMEAVFIYFIKLRNMLFRYQNFYSQFIDFLATAPEDSFMSKLLIWVENYQKFVNTDNNFADITDLLISWQGDRDFVDSKIDIIKNSLIYFIQLKELLLKYHAEYSSLTEIF